MAKSNLERVQPLVVLTTPAGSHTSVNPRYVRSIRPSRHTEGVVDVELPGGSVEVRGTVDAVTAAVNDAMFDPAAIEAKRALAGKGGPL